MNSPAYQEDGAAYQMTPAMYPKGYAKRFSGGKCGTISESQPGPTLIGCVPERLTAPPDFLGLGDQSGEGYVQCYRHGMSGIEAWVALAAFDHPDVSLVETRLFSEGLPAQLFRGPVLLQNLSESV